MPASSPPEGGKPAHSPRFTAVCLCLNVGLSISIVMVNKYIYTYYAFPNVSMTCIHFIFTTIGMLMLKWLGIFTPKTLPLRQMLPISLTFCGFVVFTNASLQNNTVGTYQIMKCLTTPCIIIIQTSWYSRSFSTKVKLTLIPIGVGVFLNSYYDLKFNVLGIVLASIGVIVTSLYQVWVAEKQKELNVNSMQLLYYQAPLSALVLVPIIPIVEPISGFGSVFTYWPPAAVALVVLSGVIAFAVNLSIYWIIGNTSPLTYNMVGHFKFCFTLILAFVVFRDPIQLMQFAGICCTFSGVFLYSQFKMAEQKEALRLAAEQEARAAEQPIRVEIRDAQPRKSPLVESGPEVSVEPLPPKL